MSLFQRFRQPRSDPGSTSPKSPMITDRRREQLRKAQRTHRERSKAYQEALEQEIIHLRARDSNALEASRAENAFLRRLLAQHGIDIPELPQFTPSVTTRIQIDPKDPKRASLQLKSSPPASEMAVDQMLSDFSLSPPDSAHTASPAPVADPTLLEIGVNFILYLEHPCMRHAHLLSPEQPSNNHAFMPTTALFQFAADPPQEAVDRALSGSEVTWQAPLSQLESLLTMSQQFVPEGELAPVQMWQLVQEAIASQKVPLDFVPDLQQRLGGFMECRGFGAAMERKDLREFWKKYVAPDRNIITIFQ